ncbi:MAG: polysaccharide deacetylase family protein [Verrucomicrobia bacterium]|nr:polysaccharide deacetylase family protein [Verrucomicrobiota bacterium]
MKQLSLIIASALALVLLAALPAADLGGVIVKLEAHQGPATVVARPLEPFKIQIAVDPKTETKPLLIRVELPNSGQRAWPAADVEVHNAQGKALMVRRTGTEWFKMLIPVPAVAGNYFVQAVQPSGGKTAPPSDKERVLADGVTGLRLGIAKWHDGRKAALSIRFDDSHPTQLTKAVPILREHGFRGTFMLNPGASEPGNRRRSDFETHQAGWEAVARQGDHEFANHSAHHRGATGDQDMEAEIGGAAQAIWKLAPGRSKLMALNLGGGTKWETTRTLRYYLDKFHQFDASENSTGMDDSYGNRVANFRRLLEQHLERGLWCRIHYHYIGEGLSSSEANFRAALDIAKEHQASLWIAGMADIHKYQAERNASKLTLVKSDPKRLTFHLTCLTDAALYDQPLTLEIMHAQSLDAGRIEIKNAHGKAISSRTGKAEGAAVLRFEVPPRDGMYSLEMTP